jgi:hypothetical protein
MAEHQATHGVIRRICAFRHFAQRAFCAAAMRLRASGDILRLWAAIETIFLPLTLAHLAR